LKHLIHLRRSFGYNLIKQGKPIYEQLEEALEKGLGDSGVSLASRLGYGVILGPVFAWYLLAKGVLSLTRSAESSASKKRILSQA